MKKKYTRKTIVDGINSLVKGGTVVMAKDKKEIALALYDYIKNCDYVEIIEGPLYKLSMEGNTGSNDYSAYILGKVALTDKGNKFIENTYKKKTNILMIVLSIVSILSGISTVISVIWQIVTNK